MKTQSGLVLEPLAIDPSLLAGFQKTLKTRELVLNKVLGRNRKGIEEWIANGEGIERSLRRDQITQTYRFLRGGHTLEQAEEVLSAHYEAQLRASSAAAAAAFFVLARGETLVPETPEEELVLGVTTGFLVASRAGSGEDGQVAVATEESVSV